MSGIPAIETFGLCKDYGENRALDGVDLQIAAGEVFALLGPNGAGKTTFVEILEGYRHRTSGDVRVLGIDPERARANWRARVGVVLQATAVFDELTVQEIIAHFAAFYPRPMQPGREAGRRLVALGFVGDPELIFLDEPTTGFDPGARRQAWDVVRGLTALGKATVLTTHYLDEAEALADRVGILIGGRLLELGTPGAIGGRATGLARVTFRREAPLIRAELPAFEPPARLAGDTVTIETSTPTQVVRDLAAWARTHGVEELSGLTITRPSLEDAYLAMVERSRDLADGGGGVP